MTKVLIVEDDAILQSAYTTILSMEGFEVTSAPDGLEGLRLATEQQFDIILLDMLMPNMNGLDFMRSFKQKTQHPSTKIIVFSNMSVPEGVKEATELGASKYLTKASYTPKEMVAIIKEVLGSDTGGHATGA